VEFDLKATPVTKQEPFMVRGDIERFRQCVLNIIENASKYSPKNSPIKVTISCDADFFSIYVTDQGPGVPVDEREKVFLPFYRANATAAHVSGTGVGLAVVKLLMERMGGNVTIENSETSGACFKLSLPRHREHESEIHELLRPCWY
jgi:signal transduction histidine kinase